MFVLALTDRDVRKSGPLPPCNSKSRGMFPNRGRGSPLSRSPLGASAAKGLLALA